MLKIFDMKQSNVFLKSICLVLIPTLAQFISPMCYADSKEKVHDGKSTVYKIAENFFPEIMLISTVVGFKNSKDNKVFLNIYRFDIASRNGFFSPVTSIDITDKVKITMSNNKLRRMEYSATLMASQPGSRYIFLGMKNEVYQIDYIEKKLIKSISLKKFGVTQNEYCLENYFSLNDNILTFFVKRIKPEKDSFMIRWNISGAPDQCTRNYNYVYNGEYAVLHSNDKMIHFNSRKKYFHLGCKMTEMPLKITKPEELFALDDCSKIDFRKGRGILFSKHDDKIEYVNQNNVKINIADGHSAIFGSDAYIYYLKGADLWRISPDTLRKDLVYQPLSTNRLKELRYASCSSSIIYTRNRRFLACQYILSIDDEYREVRSMAVFDLKRKELYIIDKVPGHNAILVLKNQAKATLDSMLSRLHR